MEKQVQNLLTQVSTISKKYDEIAAIAGENFNIFKVLKMEKNEVRTHSAFLAELLNPNGSHGKGDIFLKLFIEEIRVDKTSKKHSFESILYHEKFSIKDFDTVNSKIEVEKSIGEKTKDTGGILDIVISSSEDRQIIIENKIDAIDQPAQLIRYYNYGGKNPLFYLEKWQYSNKPHPISTDLEIINEETNEIIKTYKLAKGIHYKSISYEVEIVNWLEACIKVANNSLLETIITQYLNLVRYLTDQTLNKDMKKELVELIQKNEDSIEAAFAIHDKKELKKQLLEKFMKQITINDELKDSLIYLKAYENKKKDIFELSYEINDWNKAQLYIGFFGKDEYSSNAYIGLWHNTEIDICKWGEKIKVEFDRLDIGEDLKWSGYLAIYSFPLIDFGNNGKIWKNISASEEGKQVIHKIAQIVDVLKSIQIDD